MFELVPFSRVGSLNRLRHDADTVWDRFFNEPGFVGLPKQELFTPSVNFKETDEALEISAEILG